MAVSANRLELLQIADAVAREKSIDREIVLAAMADAIQKAARSRYGQETNIRADINARTGEIKLQRLLEVVETVEDPTIQIALELARDRNPDAQVGDFIAEQLPPMDFGRIAAQSAKQVIVQKVREAERDRQYDEYKDRVGEIVNGTVKRVEYGNVIVDLGRGEAIIRVNALQPAEVAKVVLDEDAERIEVVVPDDQLSLAIGRRGQNVRLASQLTGWDIDILTEQEESERRQAEFHERSQLFMEALDVDEMVGQVLASEGFASVEEIAYVDRDEIASIDGFDEGTADEIQARAQEYLDRLESERDAKRRELGVSDDLREVPGMTTAMMVALGEDGARTIEDFAGYAVDDLVGWRERKEGETIVHDGVLTPFEVARADAEEMVLAARVKCGWIEEAAPEEEKAGSEVETESAQA